MRCGPSVRELPLDMDSLHSIFINLLQSLSLCLMLLLAAAGLSKRKTLSRVCFWMAFLR